MQLPLSLNLFGSLRWQCICNDRAGFGIRDGGRQVSSPLRGVGVLAMPDVGLDIMRCVESVCMVQLGADVLRLLVLGAAVGVIIDRRCEVDGVEVTR
jgi:hypothetical protein